MQKTPLWHAISTTLITEIAEGIYAPGDKLPSEAALAARFGVNRHTVRHALADMAERDLVFSRRGAGVFVTQKPTDYPIGRRVRFHQNLSAAGHVPAKEILSLQTHPASAEEADLLGLQSPAPIHAYEGISLSDGQPIAYFRSVFPADRFPGLLEDLRETRSVTAALARQGVADYTRATTRLTAVRATAVQALHLRIAENDPVLRSVSINIDNVGIPIEYGITYFAGDRVTLTVTPGEGDAADDKG